MWWLAAIGWTLAVVAFLWMPPPKVHTPLPISDKTMHFILFFGIGLTWHRVLARAWPVFVGAAILGAVTEIGQGMLPWPRTPELADAVADCLGAAAAVLLSSRLMRGAGQRDRSP